MTMNFHETFTIEVPLLSVDCSHLFLRLVKIPSRDIIYFTKKLGSDSLSHQCEGFICKAEEKLAVDHLERLKPIEWSDLAFKAIENASGELVDMIIPARKVNEHINYPFIFHSVGAEDNKNELIYEWIVKKVDTSDYDNHDFMTFCNLLGVKPNPVPLETPFEEKTKPDMSVVEAIENIAEYMHEEERDFINSVGKYHIWQSVMKLRKEFGLDA